MRHPGFCKTRGPNNKGEGKDGVAQKMNGMCKGVAVSCASPIPHPHHEAGQWYSVCPDLDSHQVLKVDGEEGRRVGTWCVPRSHA